MHHHGVTFNFGSARVYLPAILQKCFSYDKGLWIAVTDYYMYFYITVPFPLTAAILQLINLTDTSESIFHYFYIMVLKNHFPRLWGTHISDATFFFGHDLDLFSQNSLQISYL